MRTFRKTFAFFVQLPQDLETRLLLRDRALEAEGFALSLSERFLLRMEMLFRGA